MNESGSERDLLNELAYEFAERFRRGERPALTEYTRKYPELAAEIRDLFPAMAMMEQFGSLGGSGPETSHKQSVVPEQLGEYRILREVGRGGMGIVYEAEQESLGRHVALKVLAFRSSASPVYLQRFRREARSAARLHHTNIVPVFDVGEFQGTQYYAMQFIQGQGLDAVLDDLRRLRGAGSGKDGGRVAAAEHEPAPAKPLGADPQLTARLAQGILTNQFAIGESGPIEDRPANPVPGHGSSCATQPLCPSSPSVSQGSDLSTQSDYHFYRSVARVGLQVAEALAYAHGQKVLHRDIKPANLLLDLKGTAWVTDFGLAKEEGDDLTQTGDLVGTLRYMAPERFNGESGPRSDIYSLGLTLYELLTLRSAFEESDRARLIRRVTNEEPPRPRRLDPHLPRDLETIVLKAIAKEPRLRYASAEDMAEDLRRFLADRPIQARRSAVWEHAWRWCRRNPLLASMSATVSALLMVVGVGLPVAVLLRSERDRAVAAESEAQQLLERAGKAEGEVQFRSHLARAAVYRQSGESGQHFKGYAEVKHAVRLARKLNLGPQALAEARNEAIACLCLPDLDVTEEWDGWPAGSTGFTLDANFQMYARSDARGDVSVRRRSDDTELCHLPGKAPPGDQHHVFLQFSPDSRFLNQFCEGPRAWSRLWKLAGDKPRMLLDDHLSLAFSPDSRQGAAGYPDGSVRILDLDSCKELHRFSLGMPRAFDLSWNPRLPQVLACAGRELRLLHLDAGTVERLTPPVPGQCGVWSWHPEGRILAFFAGENGYLWEPAKGLLPVPALDGKLPTVCLHFSPDGTRLLSQDWSGLWRLWDTRSGQLLLSLPVRTFHAQFSADSGLVAADLTAPKVRLFRYHSGREFRSFWSFDSQQHKHNLGGNVASLDATSRLLALSTSRQGTIVVDIVRLETVATVPADGCLGFDPDGSLWTSGRDGVFRWPSRLDGKTGRRRLGPPEYVYSGTNSNGQHAKSADGKLIAIPRPGGSFATLLQRDTDQEFQVGPQRDVRACALSPDGRWLATGSHYFGGAKVWNARTREHVKNFDVGDCCGVQFSPDGRWLLTTGGGPRLWETDTWRKGPDLRGTGYHSAVARSVAFSSDGKRLAVGDGAGVIRLVVAATGQELARLTAPEKTRLWPLCFTEDDAELITIGAESWGLHIFDLRSIRRQLAELGLDWDASPIPPALDVTAAPLTVEVDPGELATSAAGRQAFWRGQAAVHSLRLALNPWDFMAAVGRSRAHAHLGKSAEAIDDAARAVLLVPPEQNKLLTGIRPLDLNNWAWMWASKPARDDQGQKALLLATRAVHMAPDEWLYRNTLGVVHYRLGDYQKARENLERSLRDSQSEAAAFDLFFLAMCYQRLGDASRARASYDRAVRWVEQRRESASIPPSWAAELAVFRKEADLVLNGECK